MAHEIGFLYASLFCFFLCIVVVAVQLTSSRRCLPPGPKPDFFIGNLRQMPVDYQEKTFFQWSKIYGDVVHVSVLGKSLVILNSLRAARDLLDKKSGIYSDRPRFVLLTELMGWDSVITHMPYGDRFKRHRKLIQDQLHKDILPTFRGVQEREVVVFLQGLMHSPDLFRQHIRRFAASSILKITYGHTVTSLNDHLIHAAEKVTIATVEAGSPGSTPVDILPFLKYIPAWFPGAGFKKRALDVRKGLQSLFETPFREVKRKMESGRASWSFTASLIEEHQSNGIIAPEDEEDIKGAAGVLYSAASDTTSCILSTFFLAMVLHPEAFQKAQKEIDEVVGGDRLPTFEDRPSLPYLECLLMEIYRWQCPVPLAIPHKSTKADIYRDYYIPNDSMMIPNIWAMTQDPLMYPEPEIFRPERFLKENGQVDKKISPDFVYGFGRRICPGKDLADLNLWLVMAAIIATFDIKKACDEHGNAITPPAAFTSGFVCHPKPFVCSIEARQNGLPKIVSQINTDDDV